MSTDFENPLFIDENNGDELAKKDEATMNKATSTSELATTEGSKESNVEIAFSDINETKIMEQVFI